MTDQLYLSIWLNPLLKPDQAANRRRQFEAMLRLFPFSQREQPQTTISILAVNSTEPPLLERPMNGPFEVDDVVDVLKDYNGDDIAYQLESWWDLWVYEDKDWKLRPTRVVLSCFNPEFDNGTGADAHTQEDLRIDFGVDAYFLPQPELPGSPKLIESNVKALLRLSHEVENSLPVAKRLLNTESGTNFVERLQEALAGMTGYVQ